MKQIIALATILTMLASQLSLFGDRFQTIAMQGANQTKVINVPANEVAQIVYTVSSPETGTPPTLFHKLTINMGGVSATFTTIGNKGRWTSPSPPITLGTLAGPEGIFYTPIGIFPYYNYPNQAKVDHITGAGPIIVGPATMTFASTADANAAHKAIHTIRFFPNPNIMGIKQ